MTMVMAALAGVATGDVLLQDSFTGGGLGTNDGIGGDWNTSGQYHMTSGEDTTAPGTFTRQVDAGYGNGGLLSQDTYDSWTAEGHTYSWITGQVDPGSGAYTHELWVTKASHSNTGKANLYWNNGGGLALRLTYTPDGEEIVATGTLYICSTQKDDKSTGTGTLAAAEFTFDSYDGIDWLTSQMYVTDAGLEMYLSESVSWGSSIAGAATDANGLSVSWADVNAALDAGVVDASILGDTKIGDLLSHQTNSGTNGIGSTDEIRVQTGNALIPEPATMTLLALGGLVALRRRK